LGRESYQYVSDEGTKERKKMSIGDQFVGLPVAELIGVPLAAACDVVSSD
jgi:hypothetical protein